MSFILLVTMVFVNVLEIVNFCLISVDLLICVLSTCLLMYDGASYNVLLLLLLLLSDMFSVVGP